MQWLLMLSEGYAKERLNFENKLEGLYVIFPLVELVDRHKQDDIASFEVLKERLPNECSASIVGRINKDELTRPRLY